MEQIAVPEVAHSRLKQLYTAYALAKQDLACFVEGIVLGMGLSPDDWELDTSTMTLVSQQPAEAGRNGSKSQR